MLGLHYDPKDDSFTVVDISESNIDEYEDNNKKHMQEFADLFFNWVIKGRMLVKKCIRCEKYYLAAYSENPSLLDGMSQEGLCHTCSKEA